MKRVMCAFLAMLMTICVLPMHIFAVNENVQITYYEDGSYLVEKVVTQKERASGRVTGSKTGSHYDSGGTIAWEAVLTGSFTYTGSTSSCTSASISTTVYNSAWYTASKSASKSGNTAYGSATMGRKNLGVTVQNVPVSLTLTCDADGNLS